MGVAIGPICGGTRGGAFHEGPVLDVIVLGTAVGGPLVAGPVLCCACDRSNCGILELLEDADAVWCGICISSICLGRYSNLPSL